jgi:hypothetical protein
MIAMKLEKKEIHPYKIQKFNKNHFLSKLAFQIKTRWNKISVIL